MTTPATIAQDYIALWNTTDPVGRRAKLDQHWHTDASYTDPMMAGDGLDQIDALITAMQEKYLPALRFSLCGTPDGHGDFIRFSWDLGPDQAPPLAKGTDFVRLDKGRIASVTGFLDLVPAA